MHSNLANRGLSLKDLVALVKSKSPRKEASNVHAVMSPVQASPRPRSRRIATPSSTSSEDSLASNCLPSQFSDQMDQGGGVGVTDPTATSSCVASTPSATILDDSFFNLSPGDEVPRDNSE